MVAQGKDFIMNECGGGTYDGSEPSKLPKVDFSTFIISLYSSALVQMGDMPDPVTGKRMKDLALARQTIDMIDMLKSKTKGNLDGEEEHLMSSLIHELKMAYVKAKC